MKARLRTKITVGSPKQPVRVCVPYEKSSPDMGGLLWKPKSTPQKKVSFEPYLACFPLSMSCQGGVEIRSEVCM